MVKNILIKNVLLYDEIVDVLIEDNKFSRISKNINLDSNEENLNLRIIDGNNKAILPSFMNGHTHAGMMFLRGYGEDMELHEWLEKKVWPMEAKLTPDDCYHCLKFACLEMIKSGTTFFVDMYWHILESIKAVEEMGLRASLGFTFIDFFDEEKGNKDLEFAKGILNKNLEISDRIILTLNPHSIYTVSKETLIKIKDLAKEFNLNIHIHMSETEKEVNDCLEKYGLRPIEFLESIDFLNPNVIMAHVVWINDKEIELLKKNKVNVVTNPVSNMKLSVKNIFDFNKFKESNILIGLGTDGVSSNNTLSMIDSMKFFGLLNKLYKGSESITSNEIFEIATQNVAKMFNLKVGEIKEGYLADCILVDLDNIKMQPVHDLIANLIYSADTSCIDTTICNGKVLMENGIVEGEEKIVKNFKAVVDKIFELENNI